jgi:hypothetical protein
MVKNVAKSASSQNKNQKGQHRFLLFKTINIVVQFANISPNQLQTKFNTRKQRRMKTNINLQKL